MSYKDLKRGDEVYIKGKYDEYDLHIDQTWVDFETDGAWVPEATLIPASEIEGLDSWELAARIVARPMSDFNDIFGEATLYDVFNKMKPLEVKRKLDEYEQSKIQMGDLVEVNCHGVKKPGIFVGDNGDDYCYVLIPGYECVQRYRTDINSITKLEHNKLDILGALKSIE